MGIVLIVANTLGLVEAFLEDDINELNRLGYEIHLACNTEIVDPSHSEWLNSNQDVEIHHIGFPIRSLVPNELLNSYFSLVSTMRELAPEVVHCHTSIASALTRQATSKLDRKPIIIYTSHGFPFYEGCNKIKEKLFRLVENHYSKRTNAIITICREDYENALQMHCPKVYLTHGMGISMDRYDNTDFNQKELRRSLGISEKSKIILSIGEICNNKNHEVIIRALSFINQNDLIYVICGREVAEIGKRAELEQLANNLGVKVLFLGYRRDIENICRIASIGAIPSFKEGLGLSGIEMLAAGIPVVGSCRQGIKDYVINGVTGYLCDPKSPEDFAKGIESAFVLTTNPNTVEKCKTIAQQYCERVTQAERSAIYQSILNRA